MCLLCINRSANIRASLVLLIMAVFTLSSCAQLGPGLVQAGRNDYNKVLAQTDDEETLLNLVRMRYADNPVILQVSSVSTSFSWNQGHRLRVYVFHRPARLITSVSVAASNIARALPSPIHPWAVLTSYVMC